MPKIRFQECLRSGKKSTMSKQFAVQKVAEKFHFLEHDFLPPLAAVTLNYLSQNLEALMPRIFLLDLTSYSISIYLSLFISIYSHFLHLLDCHPRNSFHPCG